jgi:hypothetical protein
MISGRIIPIPGMLVRRPVVAPCSELQGAPILKEMIDTLIAHGLPASSSGVCARSWIHGMQGAW